MVFNGGGRRGHDPSFCGFGARVSYNCMAIFILNFLFVTKHREGTYTTPRTFRWHNYFGIC